MTTKFEIDRAWFDNAIADVLDNPAGSSQKKLAINTVATYLFANGVIDMWTHAICNQLSYRDPSGREDVAGVISEKILTTLSTAQRATTKQVRDWVGFLFQLSKNAVRDYLGTAQVTVASGMSSATRRQATIRITRNQLTAELGREPTNQEIIDRANAHMIATRKNPGKQGALLSMDDFVVAAGTAASLSDRDFDVAASSGVETNAELAWAIRRMQEIASELHPDRLDTILVVLESWAMLVAEGDSPNKSALMRMTDLPMNEVAFGLEAIEDILTELRGGSQSALAA